MELERVNIKIMAKWYYIKINPKCSPLVVDIIRKNLNNNMGRFRYPPIYDIVYEEIRGSTRET